MAGLFSKGGVPLTPAQQNLLGEAQQQQSNFAKTWLPVQQYYSQTLRANKGALSQEAQGLGAATARTQGALATQRVAQRDSARSGLGSGKFFSDTSGLSNATAGAAGDAETQGALSAQKAYEQGLAKVLQLGMADQGLATRGTQTAAGLQAQEAGAAQQQSAQTAQGLGTVAGLALTAL